MVNTELVTTLNDLRLDATTTNLGDSTRAAVAALMAHGEARYPLVYRLRRATEHGSPLYARDALAMFREDVALVVASLHTCSEDCTPRTCEAAHRADAGWDAVEAGAAFDRDNPR